MENSKKQNANSTSANPQHKLISVILRHIWKEKKITRSLQIQLGHEGITKL